MEIHRSHETPLKINRRISRSTLVFYVTPFRFEFQLSGPISSRGRRTVLLMAYRKMRELFGDLSEAEINHAKPDYISMLFPPRPLSLRETPTLDSPNSKAGYSLRLIRHRNRLTLRELSELTGLNLGHLSEIERGKHTPSRDTVRKIETSLARYEEEGILCLSTNRTRHPKNFRKMPFGPKSSSGSSFHGKLSEMYKAQQERGASKIDSDPPPNA